jgi:hypothetical protein
LRLLCRGHKLVKNQLTQGRLVWAALRTALEAMRPAVNEQSPLQIIIVGSVVGGPGSNTFLDTALLLRLLAQQHDLHHVLRGLIALPSAFVFDSVKVYHP